MLKRARGEIGMVDSGMTPSLRQIYVCCLLLSVLNPRVAGQPSVAAPNRWEKDIIVFELLDKENPPRKQSVVFVGGSSIRRWNLDAHFPNKRVVNRGFGGARSADVLLYVDRIVTKYDPSAVVVYAGGNDIGGRRKETRTTAETVYENIVELCRRVHTVQANTPILFISIKPSIKKWEFWPEMRRANLLIKKYADETPLVEYVDIVPSMLDEQGLPKADMFVEDGGHLNESGYRVWSQEMGSALSSILGERWEE
jgi:lysophospholipase L1-like esterase